MTLTEKAKALRRRGAVTERYAEEEIDLCLAWVRGEVSGTQIGRVMGYKTTGSPVYAFLAPRLRQYILAQEAKR